MAELRTAVKTKQVGGHRERGEGSALLVRDPIRATEELALRARNAPCGRWMRRFAAAATKETDA